MGRSRRPARSSGPSCMMIAGIGCGVLMLGVVLVCGAGLMMGWYGYEGAKKELAEANRRWDAGQKGEAVATYRALLAKSLVVDRSQEPVVYLRVIEHDLERGDNASARQLADQALEKGVDLRPDRPESAKLVADVRADRERRAAEELARKEADARRKADERAAEAKRWQAYTFLKSKKEGRHVMDLYVCSGELDVGQLKVLCKERKQSGPAEIFYYLVVFDQEANARFPKDPITAEYGIEEDALSHIRAVYVYNKANGLSELRYYDSNAWEGKATREKL